MPDVAFQLKLCRAPNGGDVTALAYGFGTPIVFPDPPDNTKLYVSAQVLDTNGAQAGEEVEISLIRDGGDVRNTTTSPATAILLNLAIPVKATS